MMIRTLKNTFNIFDYNFNAKPKKICDLGHLLSTRVRVLKWWNRRSALWFFNNRGLFLFFKMSTFCCPNSKSVISVCDIFILGNDDSNAVNLNYFPFQFWTLNGKWLKIFTKLGTIVQEQLFLGNYVNNDYKK